MGRNEDSARSQRQQELFLSLGSAVALEPGLSRRTRETIRRQGNSHWLKMSEPCVRATAGSWMVNVADAMALGAYRDTVAWIAAVHAAWIGPIYIVELTVGSLH